MKLLYSTTSPFVRKVRIFLQISELAADVEYELINPFEDKKLRKSNPLNKIPVLQDGNLTLIESNLICEYLDEKYLKKNNHSLFHRNEPDYYNVQLALMQANGITDAAVASLLEKRRTDAEQSAHWLNRWYQAIRCSVENFDCGYAGSSGQPNIATISMACALGYLDFRFDEFGWRDWNSELTTWFTEIENQDWFLATAPE